MGGGRRERGCWCCWCSRSAARRERYAAVARATEYRNQSNQDFTRHWQANRQTDRRADRARRGRRRHESRKEGSKEWEISRGWGVKGGVEGRFRSREGDLKSITEQRANQGADETVRAPSAAWISLVGSAFFEKIRSYQVKKSSLAG